MICQFIVCNLDESEGEDEGETVRRLVHSVHERGFQVMGSLNAILMHSSWLLPMAKTDCSDLFWSDHNITVYHSYN